MSRKSETVYIGPHLDYIGGIAVFLNRKLKSHPHSSYITFKKTPFHFILVLFKIIINLSRGKNLEWHRSRFRCNILLLLCFSKNFKFVFHHGTFDSKLHFILGTWINIISIRISKNLFFVSKEMANNLGFANHYNLQTKLVQKFPKKNRNTGIIWSGQCLDIYAPLIALQGFISAKYNNPGLIDKLGCLNLYFYGECDPVLLHKVKVEAQTNPNIQLFYDTPSTEFNKALFHASTYLRTSTVDSYCVALHDALSMNKTVVASDISGRPNGCLLFRAGDYTSLSETLINILNLF